MTKREWYKFLGVAVDYQGYEWYAFQNRWDHTKVYAVSKTSWLAGKICPARVFYQPTNRQWGWYMSCIVINYEKAYFK